MQRDMSKKFSNLFKIVFAIQYTQMTLTQKKEEEERVKIAYSSY